MLKKYTGFYILVTVNFYLTIKESIIYVTTDLLILIIFIEKKRH